MNNLKRVLSTVLAGTMLAGMMVVGASAASFPDADEIEHNEAVDTLTALNIVTGKDDGNYDPQGNVTRGEMAKLITVALNGGKAPVLGTKTTPTYTDIKGHWAESYIEYCSNLGIIGGRGDGTFDPNGSVTGSEAAKMMLVAMGWDSTIFNFTGADWALNVNTEANKVNLYDELETIDPSAPLNRDNTAQLVYNGIMANTMVKSPNMTITNGEITWEYRLSADTIFSTKFGGKVFIGTFEGNYNTGAAGAAKGEIQIRGNLTTDNTVVGSVGYVAPKSAEFPYDLDISYIGEEFKVIYKEGRSGQDGEPDSKDTIYGVFNTGKVTVYNITKGDLQDASTNTAKGKIKFGGEFHDVAAFAVADTDAEVIVNNYGKGTTITVDDLDGNNSNNDGATAAEFATYINAIANGLRVNSNDAIKFVTNAKGEIVKAYVENWTYTKVLNVTDTKLQLEGIGSKDVADVNFIDEVEKGDIVAYAEFFGGVTEYQVKAAETLTGTVDAINNVAEGTRLQIDGTWYSQSVNTEKLNDYATTAFTVGSEYNFVLDGKYWVAADTISTSVDYAMVLKTATGINEQAKLLLADGTVKTFIINDYSTLKHADFTAVNTNVKDAVLVKYELVKEGTEVKMTAADTVTDSSGTDSAAYNHSFNKTTKVLTTITTSDATDKVQVVSDTAVAFIFDGTKWKVFDANTIASVAAVDNTAAYYATAAGKVAAFALTTTAMPTGAGAGSGYGYITGRVVTKDAKGNDIINLSIWNGSETVTVTVDGKATTAGHAAGNFVKYTVSDVAVDKAEVTASGTAVKVKEYDAERGLVITTDGLYSVTGELVGETAETVYVLDNDSVIIGVNTATVSGEEYQSITEYTKISGSDFDNAHIIYETVSGNRIIKAIFVDVNNKIAASGNAGDPVTVTGLNEVAMATNGAKIAITADKSEVLVGETVTFTVTVSGTATSAGANGGITINGATVANVDLDGASSVPGSNITNATVASNKIYVNVTAAGATSATYTFTGVVTGAVSFTNG